MAGLRNLVNECDQTISGHLRKAERHTQDLAHIHTGDDVIARIARIVETARGAPRAAQASPAASATAAAAASSPQPPAAKAQSRLAATLAAAQGLAQRRLGGAADAATARGSEAA